MDNHNVYQRLIAFTAAVYQVHANVTKDVKLEGITLLQYKIVELLAVSPPLTLSQIAECINLSLPNASREIKKLSEKNLCEKISDTEDRRKLYIRLSPHGMEMMAEVFQSIEAAFSQIIKDKSIDNLSEIDRALTVLQSKVFYSIVPPSSN